MSIIVHDCYPHLCTACYEGHVGSLWKSKESKSGKDLLGVELGQEGSVTNGANL